MRGGGVCFAVASGGDGSENVTYIPRGPNAQSDDTVPELFPGKTFHLFRRSLLASGVIPSFFGEGRVGSRLC